MKALIGFAYLAFAVTFLVACTPDQSAQVISHDPAPTPGKKTPTTQNNNDSLQGTMDGGGGSAVVCRQDDGEIKSVQLLDLYEAEHILHLQAESSKGSVDDEWLFFAGKLSDRKLNPKRDSSIKFNVDLDEDSLDATQTTWKSREFVELMKFRKDFRNYARFVGDEVRLKRIDDSHEVFTVPGCQVVQVANYQDDGKILIQKEYWDKMSARDQAGLIAHEFIYKIYRDMGAKTSVKTRRIIGQVFSTKPVLPIHQQIDNPNFTCTNILRDGSNTNMMSLSWFRIEVPADPNEQMIMHYGELPDQILIEPSQAKMPLRSSRVIGDQDSLKSCSEKPKLLTFTDDTKIDIRTSYFVDTYQIHFDIRCQPVKNRPPMIQFGVILKNQSGNEERYLCEPDKKLAKILHLPELADLDELF